MKASLALGAYRRTTGAFPEIVLENMLVEQTPARIENPESLVCRPGLEDFVMPGSGVRVALPAPVGYRVRLYETDQFEYGPSNGQ